MTAAWGASWCPALPAMRPLQSPCTGAPSSLLAEASLVLLPDLAMRTQNCVKSTTSKEPSDLCEARFLGHVISVK